MQNYIKRRLLLMVPTLLLITIIAFVSIRFIPGNAIELMVSEMAWESGMGTELTVEHIKRTLGLDVPVYVQYGRWLANVVRGNLGESLWTKRAVIADLAERLPVTAELGILAIVIGIIIAIPIGIYSAIRQDTAGDYLGRTISILSVSIPPFWIGTIIFVYPSIWWGWSPSIEYVPFFQNPLANLSQFILPAFVLGMFFQGTIMRLTRTMMLEVLRQDYVRTAWSKGLNERIVVIRHALKNALIPVASQIGILFAVVLGGSVVVEQIFCLPGMGLFIIQALNKRDYPIISGINLFLAGVVLIVNLAVDLSYAYLDPRVQYK